MVNSLSLRTKQKINTIINGREHLRGSQRKLQDSSETIPSYGTYLIPNMKNNCLEVNGIIPLELELTELAPKYFRFLLITSLPMIIQSCLQLSILALHPLLSMPSVSLYDMAIKGKSKGIHLKIPNSEVLKSPGVIARKFFNLLIR
uniref:Uncharacterized protein n=1 Tax=Rhodnius prolixus TaxID=13249 RepID=T1HF11_RHOPR